MAAGRIQETKKNKQTKKISEPDHPQQGPTTQH